MPKHIFDPNYTVCLIAIAIDLSGNYSLMRSQLDKKRYLPTSQGRIYTLAILLFLL
ncbi:MAG: hypothetical protein RMZ41_025150 [Nostoc sp. DedVER02]|uniref:hypothetical protein n=1 Tax=unclassified Nostoc TaxID=2593658 RepID=UPI002AD5A85D|nr:MULTISPECIES: hypothetical protein [unclassified Nostoc]MDZ7986094.1 hypothetical protein [Nostoc sp. DedVER02]MDZ8115401.1 hypothetical protein [Nostoc sp. DedVER01b]